MAIFEINALSEDYTALVFTDKLEHFNQYLFEGKPQRSWEPLTFKWYLPEGQSREDLTIGDFALVIGAGVNLVLNEKTKALFEPVLKDDVQFLPVNIEDESENWYLINITHVVEHALSLEHSRFKIRRNGSVGRLEKAVFKDRNIPDNRVFVYPQANNRFMAKGGFLEKLIDENRLKGVEFTKYDSV